MTAQQELNLLETAYTAALEAGGVTTYSINGRMVTRDLNWLTKRIDVLRAQVARASQGMFAVGQFRSTD